MTIRRSWIGKFFILAIALFIEMFVISSAYWLRLHDGELVAVELLLIVALGVLIAATERLIVYSMGKMELTTDGVTVTNYTTLWNYVRATTEWNQVEDVTVKGNGLLNLLTFTGTIYIQSAGTEPNFALSWVTDADDLRAFMAQTAEKANPNA